MKKITTEEISAKFFNMHRLWCSSLNFCCNNCACLFWKLWSLSVSITVIRVTTSSPTHMHCHFLWMNNEVSAAPRFFSTSVWELLIKFTKVLRYSFPHLCSVHLRCQPAFLSFNFLISYSLVGPSPFYEFLRWVIF